MLLTTPRILLFLRFITAVYLSLPNSSRIRKQTSDGDTSRVINNFIKSPSKLYFLIFFKIFKPKIYTRITRHSPVWTRRKCYRTDLRSVRQTWALELLSKESSDKVVSHFWLWHCRIFLQMISLQGSIFYSAQSQILPNNIRKVVEFWDQPHLRFSVQFRRFYRAEEARDLQGCREHQEEQF